MILSQLPHVLANVDTPGTELSAASTLSTLLATAWTKYLARAEITEPEIGAQTPFTVTGGISTDKNKFCMQTLNIQGGIAEADKLMAIQDIVTKYQPDAMAISEAGQNCKANTLKWLNKQLKETKSGNENAYLSSLEADFPYTIVSANTTAEHERGGIVFLLHNKWRHRVVGKPIIDHNGRWICIDVRTPRGRTSIIATYLPPSPQNSAAAKLAWAELQAFVISRHLKRNRIVYLFGDLNASRSIPLHRKNTGEEDTGQDRLLNNMMEHGGLVDTYPICNPLKQYKTWQNHNTWSSPDHILVSAHTRHHVTASQTSNETVKLHGLDHHLLTTYIDVNGSVDIAPEKRNYIKFDRKKAAEYASELDKELESINADDNEEDKAHAFFKCCLAVARRLFSSTRRAPPKSSGKVLQIKNDVKAINIALYHVSNDTRIPHKIKHRAIFAKCDMSTESLRALKITAKTELNSKSRKRTILARRLYTNRRSGHFTNGRLGPFLCSALSKYSTFRGVESIYNTLTGAVTSIPEEVKSLTTKRISSTFYERRIPSPAYAKNLDDAQAWNLMPQWYRKTFHNIKTRRINPDLANSMRPVSEAELRSALARLGKNKTGGPSELTAEMLVFASPAAQTAFILPFVNECIRHKNTPMFTKNFNVWLIEKTKGVGPILHPTNKLDVRPISLFEISFKLVETILATRINDALEPKLNPAQHAFNAIRSVVDAIITYTMVMEDANQYRKEIHISNNDCTQAYDAVPPWAMYAVYRYHGFPPDLINMLMNMDDNMKGRVLTAHGAGSEWTKTCGLGQGSVLAPLKWNLFLDPLLNMLQHTSDPYILSNGITSIELRVLAFADDTTIFASTHKGYLERMAMAGEYFGIFGVNFSPTKTHYTYAHTKGRHYKSAPITVRNPDGTTSVQPSSVTSPHKPLRYLGAWLSPTLNWLPAKRKLRDEVTKLLTILRLKTLSPAEYKYTVQSVIHSKLRYYLAVVPLLDSELEEIDRKIAHIMKKRMHMASSCSSPLLFLPDNEYGAELPSIKDTRATMLIATAHNLLNNNHSTLGKIARMRLTHLQDSLGWATNPLNNPDLITTTSWNKHWCARVGILLASHGATISDTHGSLNKQGCRSVDKPLHTLYTRTAFSAVRQTLKKHGLYWLGQLTNPQGTKLTPKSATGSHHQSPWWKALQSTVTNDTGTELKTPISPTTSPITRFIPTHNPGTIVTSYTKNPKTEAWEHKYYKVTDSHMDDNRESCYVTELYECSTKLRSLHRRVSLQEKKTNRLPRHRQRRMQITRTGGHPFYKGDNHTDEFADALHPIKATWARVTPHDCHPLDVAIIHDTCFIKTRKETITGTTTAADLAAIATKTLESRCPLTGEHITHPRPSHHDCDVCGHSQADQKCVKTTCTNYSHGRCTSSQPWTCSQCTIDRSKVEPLHPSHLQKLEERLLTHTIYSASDGSVKGAGTGHSSSSFGLVIDHLHTNVRRRGKITIREGEESSLRVELEALIHAYYLIPSHIKTIHAIDNETALEIHNALALTGLPPQRKLMHMPYHSTIVRLNTAMQHRKTFLELTHTLSHLESTTTQDTDLKHRRDALAKADHEADIGHQTHYFIQDDSGIEDFALRINGILVEKAATTPFARIQTEARKTLLYARHLEGANHRAGNNPGWNTGGRQWPNFLRIFRHKLITQRLPTAYNRARRGDSENGTQVNPWCPLCATTGTFTIETHEHLLTCPCTSRDRLKLARAINNNCRPYYQPKHIHTPLDPDTEEEIMATNGMTWDITEGWESHMSDKHGRKTRIAQGPEGRNYNGARKLTSWAHSILRHVDDHIEPQHQYGYIQSIQAGNSIDPHLLQGLAQAINATTIHDTIPHNPFIPTPTLDIMTPSTGGLPTVLNACDSDLDWASFTEHLDHDRPWVILMSDSQTDLAQEHIPTKPFSQYPQTPLPYGATPSGKAKLGYFLKPSTPTSTS